jgi:ADP-ribose pyrophosphatase YjhB (NUDIX family)
VTGRVPRAVAVVIDGSRVLLIKRYLRRESSDDCAMCEAGAPRLRHGDPQAGGGALRAGGGSETECPGHRYAVLPGGHVEAGETYEEAALRELHEETGLRATIGRPVYTGRHNGRPATYFLMTEVGGVPVLSGPEAEEDGPDNSFELRWASADQFEALNLHPADIRPVLADLLAPASRANTTGERGR